MENTKDYAGEVNRIDNYNFNFLTQAGLTKQLKIKHNEVKKDYNNITNRNAARERFTNTLQNLINITEYQTKFLTAADVREFRAAFTSIISEL